MAIYHCSVKVVKRSTGRSITAAAAYRAGCVIIDTRTGQLNDYTKKSGIDHTAILAPANAPEFVHDRAQLWNTVEQIEKRKDAQLAREVEVALPRELNLQQQIELLNSYIKKQFVNLGMIADVAIHNSKGKTPHAHILLTMREINQEGFGNKNREWNQTPLLEDWREEWAKETNKALERVNAKERVDHRSFEAQGIDQLPTIKLGTTAHQLEQQGIKTERGNINRSIQQLNHQQAQIKADIIDLQKAKEERDARLEQTPPKPSPTEPQPSIIQTKLELVFTGLLQQAQRTLHSQKEEAHTQLEQAEQNLKYWQTLQPQAPTGLFAFFKYNDYQQDFNAWQQTYTELERTFENAQAESSKQRPTAEALAEQNLERSYPELAAEKKRLERLKQQEEWKIQRAKEQEQAEKLAKEQAEQLAKEQAAKLAKEQAKQEKQAQLVAYRKDCADLLRTQNLEEINKRPELVDIQSNIDRKVRLGRERQAVAESFAGMVESGFLRIEQGRSRGGMGR